MTSAADRASAAAARATSPAVALGAASTGAERTCGMGVILLRHRAFPIGLHGRFGPPMFVRPDDVPDHGN